MAAPMKREHLEIAEVNISDENTNKKSKTEPFVNDRQLNAFLKVVTVQRKGSCAQYGMIALEDIAEGYCLFQVPRPCLLVPENTISHLIEEDASILDAKNKWIPLLLSLIHEQNNPNSKWRPYLDLVPDYDALDLPLFWDRSSVQNLLANSKVDDSVTRDLKMIEEDFDKFILPFFQRHETIKSDLKDLEHLKKLVAFVMSYSFTEPRESKKAKNGDTDNGDDNTDESSDEEEEQEVSPPMMVPMADMLNHVTKHNAKLTFGTEALKMVTIQNISKGEEIFNTYGEVSNLHLMHMYGFTECYPENFYDVVEIPIGRMLEAATQICADKGAKSNFLDKKWNFLKDQEALTDEEVFVLNKDGIITDEICLQALKIICMSESEFTEHQEREGWNDAESESSLSGDSRLSFEKIPSLDEKWITLLKRMAEIHMSKYNTTLSEDKKKLKQLSSLTKRERFSLFLVHGQKMLLQELTDVCNSSLVHSLEFL